MKTLTIRQMPDLVHEALKMRAARNLRSMEEEVRRIIGEGLKEEISTLEGKARGIDPAEISAAYSQLFDCPGGSKTKVFRHFFTRGFTVNEVHKALSGTVFPNLIYQHVWNEHERWKNFPAESAAPDDRQTVSVKASAAEIGAAKRAAVERLQSFVRKLWGGDLPQDVVDSFLKEKREETVREEAKAGF